MNEKYNTSEARIYLVTRQKKIKNKTWTKNIMLITLQVLEAEQVKKSKDFSHEKEITLETFKICIIEQNTVKKNI